MSAAMNALRSALEEEAGNFEKKIIESANHYLRYLEEYLNEGATMSEAQAETLIEDILQWHIDSSLTEKGEDNFIKIATYVNSCR